MDPATLSLCLAIASAVTLGISKTALPAASILAVVLMTAAFPDNAELSVGAMLPVLLVGDLFAVAWFRQHAQWDRLVGLFPYVAVGMVPAFFMITWLDGNQSRPVIGWMVMAMVALELARNRFQWNGMPGRWWFTGGVGLVAGFSTMAANAGGPVMNLYLLSSRVLKEQFVGTCAWFFFLLNLSKILPFWNQGMLNGATLRYGLSMAPAVLVGALAGLWLLPRLSQRWFEILVGVLTAGTAAWLIVV